MKYWIWVLVLCPSLSFAAPFFESHQEGWFWYQGSAQEEKKKEKEMRSIPSNPTEEMLTFRKEVEDSLNLAILYPTEENLRDYAAKYFEVIHRGQRFTDAYKIMLLKNPQYDYSLKFPTNHLTQSIQYAQEKNTTEHKVRQFVRNHGFFLFLSSRCQFCHAFAPVVKQFSEKYKAAVVPISLDGGTFPQFPKVVPDNGVANAFKVTHLPALFAIHPNKKQVIPIANGALSLPELEENILRIMEVIFHE